MESTLVPTRWEPPALLWGDDPAQVEPVTWWVIVVGFSFAAALAWSSYCIYVGGSPSISFSLWSGFKVTCSR